ncbi:hypothetical protein [Pasteurella multocida]|uniref:hypothetical protein n=1 Tax=Pasteurella multocida TaxID=747 RepID=UPI00244D6134|nr:hypothetical protein [Pasteurella multocida]MDH3001705.1 hypothetical protein [Pasteurella multocida]
MQYFDIKKSLPIFCSLFIAACGSSGGNKNATQPPIEKRTEVTTQTRKSLPTPDATLKKNLVSTSQTTVISPAGSIKISEQLSTKPNLSSVSPRQIPNNLVNKPISKESEKKVLLNAHDTDNKDLALLPNPTVTSVNSKEQTPMLPQWTGMEEKKYEQALWEHTPKSVPVFKLINIQRKYEEDKYFTLESINLDLTQNSQVEEEAYQFSLVDSAVYYGHYLSSDDNIRAEDNFVIAFDKNREYTQKDITAEYYNPEGFNYAISDAIKDDYIWQVGDVRLFYKNGSVSGEIVEVNKGSKTTLFHFANMEEINPNQIILVPEKNNRHELSPRGDRMIMDMHFINGSNDENYKYVVGHGHSERYYGTLFATKKE